MGNTGLTITVNPPQGYSKAFVAGSVVTGTVYAETTKAVKDVRMNLVFEGKEKTCIHYTTRVNEHTRHHVNEHTRHHYARAERSIVKITDKLGQAKTSMPSGKYSYPFELTLPADLPSSLLHERGSNNCTIVYTISAQVDGNKGWFTEEKIAIRVVAKPPSSSPIPYMQKPITRRVQKCFACDQGPLTFSAIVDDIRVGAGEEMEIKFGGKNESKLDITYVRLEVHENIYFAARGRKRSAKYVVARGSIKGKGLLKAPPEEEQKARDKARKEEEKIYVKELNHIRKTRSVKERREFEAERKKVLEARKETLYKEILQMVNDGVIKGQITLPETINPTYSSGLITVEHFLKITVDTPWPQPSVMIRLQIVTPNCVSPEPATPTTASNEPNALPPGWDASEVIAKPITISSGNFVYGDVESSNSEEKIPVPGEQTKLAILTKELDSTLSVRSTIQDKSGDADWSSFFSELQPKDVVALVKAVKLEFDKVEAAELVAPLVENFTCEYVVALLKVVPNYLRTQIVSKLLPFCVDLDSNSGLILDELTSWEKVSIERDFEKAGVKV